MNIIIPLSNAGTAGVSTGKTAENPEHAAEFNTALHTATTRDTKAPAKHAKASSPAKTVHDATAGKDHADSTQLAEAKKIKLTATQTGKTGAAKDGKNDKQDKSDAALKPAGTAAALPVVVLPALLAAGTLPAAADKTAHSPAQQKNGLTRLTLATVARSTKNTASGSSATGTAVDPKAGAGQSATTVKSEAKAGLSSIDDAPARNGAKRHAASELTQAVRSSTAAAQPTGGSAQAVATTANLAAQLQAVSDASSKPVKTASDKNTDAASINGLVTAGISSHAAGAQGSAGVATPATTTLTSAVGTTPWQQELGQQLVRLTQRGSQQVELQLHPAELGPLQIQLQVNQNTAQAHFIAAHALVRDAVQQAIPQLREALAGQGIMLGEALVGQQQQQQRETGGSGHPAKSSSPSSIAAIGPGPAGTQAVTQVLHLTPGRGVDLYA